MGQPFVGEIRMTGSNFAPSGWALCNGQLLSIAENNVLFALLGTTYGGDGVTTFGLPDLRGRIPTHVGGGVIQGQSGGTESVTLTTTQIPSHTHVPVGQAGAGTQPSPSGGVWAASSLNQYGAAAPAVAMSASALSSAGGSQPHNNMMPSLCVNFIISLFGIFPSHS